MIPDGNSEWYGRLFLTGDTMCRRGILALARHRCGLVHSDLLIGILGREPLSLPTAENESTAGQMILLSNHDGQAQSIGQTSFVSKVKEIVNRALAKFVPDEFRRLLIGLDLPTDIVSAERVLAAKALGAVSGPGPLNALIYAVLDEDMAVRRAAAKALGDRRDPKALDVLIRAVSDTNNAARQAAADALGKLGDPRAGDALIRALSDRDGKVRSAAASSLGALRVPQAFDRLIRALSDEEVRCAALWSLGKLGNPAAVDAILGAVSNMDDGDTSRLHGSAAKALSQLGNSAAVFDAIVHALSDKYEVVRQVAAEALGLLGNRTAVDAIIPLLSDKANGVRRAAAKALRKLGNPMPVEALIQCMHDPDEEVRQLAVEALASNRDKIDGFLLTEHLTGGWPWLDPLQPITQEWIAQAAAKLNRSIEEIRSRYSTLAHDFGFGHSGHPPRPQGRE